MEKAKKIFNWCALAALIIMICVYFFPRPIVRDPDNSSIFFIQYRPDDSPVLDFYYLKGEEADFDEKAVLECLSRSREVRTPWNSMTFQSGRVTLYIAVTDNDVSKHILLGDINYRDSSTGTPEYKILGAEALKDELLDILSTHLANRQLENVGS